MKNSFLTTRKLKHCFSSQMKNSASTTRKLKVCLSPRILSSFASLTTWSSALGNT
uniref:Uncharacterized protein n=1 Tax=Arundo donax TaxID=35708 RepID=A0A0A9GT70_ARUDO